jgi:hypothetical protein
MVGTFNSPRLLCPELVQGYGHVQIEMGVHP